MNFVLQIAKTKQKIVFTKKNVSGSDAINVKHCVAGYENTSDEIVCEYNTVLIDDLDQDHEIEDGCKMRVN